MHSWQRYTRWYAIENSELVMVAQLGYEFESNSNTAKEYFEISGECTDREAYESFIADYLELDDESYLKSMLWKQLN